MHPEAPSKQPCSKEYLFKLFCHPCLQRKRRKKLADTFKRVSRQKDHGSTYLHVNSVRVLSLADDPVWQLQSLLEPEQEVALDDPFHTAPQHVTHDQFGRGYITIHILQQQQQINNQTNPKCIAAISPTIQGAVSQCMTVFFLHLSKQFSLAI